jgi:electron transfer flavoprotein beta subunit
LLKKKSAETLVVCVGPKAAQDALRKAMAMGLDKGILVLNDGLNVYDSLLVAKVLSKIVEKEKPDLILGGQRSIDSDNGHLIGTLAELTSRPHVQVVTKIEWEGDQLRVQREVEGGDQEVLECSLPAILGAHKSLNKPRFASLPNIMKAKKKPLEEISLSDLGIKTDDSTIKVLKFRLPKEKGPGVIYRDQDSKEMVKSLLKDLKEKAKVI